MGDEFDKPYMAELRQFLIMEKQNGKNPLPSGESDFLRPGPHPF